MKAKDNDACDSTYPKNQIHVQEYTDIYTTKNKSSKEREAWCMTNECIKEKKKVVKLLHLTA
jgi:hypothetical protein